MNDELLHNPILHIHPTKGSREENKSPAQGTALPNNLMKSLNYACSFCPFTFSRIILGFIISPSSTNPQPKAFSILSIDVLLSSSKEIWKHLATEAKKHFQELHMHIFS